MKIFFARISYISLDMSESVEEPIKRSHESSIGEKELRDVFVSNIPYDVSQAGLEGALKRMFGKFEDIKA